MAGGLQGVGAGDVSAGQVASIASQFEQLSASDKSKGLGQGSSQTMPVPRKAKVKLQQGQFKTFTAKEARAMNLQVPPGLPISVDSLIANAPPGLIAPPSFHHRSLTDDYTYQSTRSAQHLGDVTQKLQKASKENEDNSCWGTTGWLCAAFFAYIAITQWLQNLNQGNPPSTGL